MNLFMTLRNCNAYQDDVGECRAWGQCSSLFMPTPSASQNSSSNIYDNRFMTMFQHGSLHWSAVAVINPGSVLKVEAGGPPESGLAKLQPFMLFFDSLVTSSHNSVWLKADLVEVMLRNFREHYPGRPKLLEESFRMKL